MTILKKVFVSNDGSLIQFEAEVSGVQRLLTASGYVDDLNLEYFAGTGTMYPQTRFVSTEQFGDKLFSVMEETVSGVQIDIGKELIFGPVSAMVHPIDGYVVSGRTLSLSTEDIWVENLNSVVRYLSLSEEPSATVFAEVTSSVGTWNGNVYDLVSGMIQVNFYAESDFSDSSSISGASMIANIGQLKNAFTWSDDIDYDPISDSIAGSKKYIKVGKSQDGVLWLTYLYGAQHALAAYDYQMMETVKGFSRAQGAVRHKSTVYSIRIKNSRLNEQIADPVIRGIIREQIEDSVRRAVERVAPKHTQLWKIEWSGK